MYSVAASKSIRLPDLWVSINCSSSDKRNQRWISQWSHIMWRKKNHTHQFCSISFWHVWLAPQIATVLFIWNIKFSVETIFSTFNFVAIQLIFLCFAKYADTARWIFYAFDDKVIHKIWKWLKYGKQKCYWFLFMVEWACGCERNSQFWNRDRWSNRVDGFHLKILRSFRFGVILADPIIGWCLRIISFWLNWKWQWSERNNCFLFRFLLEFNNCQSN